MVKELLKFKSQTAPTHKDPEASYLQQLTFDPKLAQGVLKKYLTNIRLVTLLIITIWLAGIYSFIVLPRRLNPEVKLSIVSISTVLPGAGPQDVEQLVTTPIEDAVSGVEGIDTLQSVSQENISLITMQFVSGTDRDKAKDLVQAAVDTVTNLPADAKTPQVIAFDFENQPVWQFGLTTTGDYASLKTFATELKTKIEDSSLIDKVVLSGSQDREIQVVIKPETLATYGVSAMQVGQAINSGLASFPAGTIKTDQSLFSVTIDKTISTVDDIRKTTIALNGQPVTIGDIASVVERPKPGQSNSYFANHERQATPMISFAVSKTQSADIDKAVADAKKIVAEQLKPYQGQFVVETQLDLGKQITDSFGDLVDNYRDTIILVFITLFLFLGIRQAVIACVTIPLTFLVSFTIMHATGLTLNFLSLFSLLLSLGLLVDDTIVVVTAMTAYYRTGKFTPTEAGLLVWRDFIIPIWTTTISTVWAFLPLLLSTGIIGEFIKSIPIVVSTTLYASTAIAVLITLPLMMVILKPQIARRVKIMFAVLGILILLGIVITIFSQNPLLIVIIGLVLVLLGLTYDLRRQLVNRISQTASRYRNLPAWQTRARAVVDHGLIDMPSVSHKYQVLIDRILQSKTARRRTILIVVIFSVFSYLLVPFGFVVNEFFPKQAADQLYVQYELPQGTNQSVTNDAAQVLLERLRTTEGIDYVTADVGSGLDDFGNSGSGKSNSVLYTLVLPEKVNRKVDSIQISETLRKELQNYQPGKVSIVEIGGGPPVGSDIQITFSGENLMQIDQYADQMQDYLSKQAGVINIQKSIKPGVSKIVFVPDDAKMVQHNVTRESLGLALRSFASGLPLSELKQGTDKQDITFRMGQDVQSPDQLGAIMISTGGKGESVPLSALGHFELKANPTQITHDMRKRTITVSAAVTAGYSVSQTNRGVEEFAKNLRLPSGYSWKTGGVNEENAKSVQSIFVAMILSAVLILSTMVIQFTSFRKALLVMLTIPVAISGVFIVFALTGTPLSFPALIGTLALFGIVVNNAMMIIDKVNRNQRFGMPIRHAVSDAAASRLEPIVLGSLCTVVGLIPITLSDPFWRGLGGAIISGLLFSGAIMLFFIPVVYYTWYAKEQA